MTRLVLVGDAAYPPAISTLPADLFAMCGYVGGDTPHVWGGAEVQRVLDSGRQWWPIWTAPSTGQRLTKDGGAKAGEGMSAVLGSYPVTRETPCFLDVENGSYNADVAGSKAYIAEWKTVMRSHGYVNCFAYVPWAAQTDWVAYWNNIRPTELPKNVVGWQYGGYPGIDLSIFDLDKMGADEMAGLTDADKVWLQGQLAASDRNVETWITKYVPAELGGSINRIAADKSLDEQQLVALQQLAAGMAALHVGGIDVKALSDELLSDLATRITVPPATK